MFRLISTFAEDLPAGRKTPGATDVQFEVFRSAMRHWHQPPLTSILKWRPARCRFSFLGLPVVASCPRFWLRYISSSFWTRSMSASSLTIWDVGPQYFAEFLALDLQQFKLLKPTGAQPWPPTEQNSARRRESTETRRNSLSGAPGHVAVRVRWPREAETPK